MRNILLIARREYLEQIHGRAFVFSTVLVPLLIVALLGWGAITDRKTVAGKHLAIAATMPKLAAAFATKCLTTRTPVSDVDLVRSGHPAGYCGPAETGSRQNHRWCALHQYVFQRRGHSHYTSLSSGDFANISGLQSALNRGLIDERMIARGIKPGRCRVISQTRHCRNPPVEQGRRRRNRAMEERPFTRPSSWHSCSPCPSCSTE